MPSLKETTPVPFLSFAMMPQTVLATQYMRLSPSCPLTRLLQRAPGF
jgi:hypothetical protein